MHISTFRMQFPIKMHILIPLSPSIKLLTRVAFPDAHDADLGQCQITAGQWVNIANAKRAKNVLDSFSCFSRTPTFDRHGQTWTQGNGIYHASIVSSGEKSKELFFYWNMVYICVCKYVHLFVCTRQLLFFC